MIHESDYVRKAEQQTDFGSAASSSAEESRYLIDFRVIGRAIARRKFALLLALMAVLATVGAIFALSDKSYDAISLVGLERKPEQVVNTPGDANSNLPIDMPSVDTEVTILTSPSVIRAAVERHKLHEDEAFVSAATGGDKSAPISVGEAADRIITKLTAQRQGASYVIETIYTSRDPEIAAQVTNAVVDAYINRQVASVESGRSADISVLEQRLESLRSDVLEAESAVARYKASNSLVTIGNEGTSVQDEIGNLNRGQGRAGRCSGAGQRKQQRFRVDGRQFGHRA